MAKSNSTTSDVLTLAETAELLKLCAKTVQKLAQAGVLPGRRVGSQWRFSRRAVLAYLEEGATRNAPSSTARSEE